MLEASGGGAYAPGHVKANLLSLPRIQATNMEWDFYKAFLDYYDRHHGERYVSDGDPNRVVFPVSEMGNYRPSPGDRVVSDPAPGLRAMQIR